MIKAKFEDRKVMIKRLIDNDEFKSELNGCVEISMIDPLEAKKIWKA